VIEAKLEDGDVGAVQRLHFLEAVLHGRGG
jgi:hypothetical protein